MKRNLENLVGLLETSLKKEGILLFAKDLELFALDTADGTVRKTSFKEASERILRMLGKEAKAVTGLPLTYFTARDVFSIDAFSSLCGHDSEADRARAEELLSEAALIRQFLGFPDRAIARCMGGGYSEEEADVTCRAVFHAQAMLEDSDASYMEAVDALPVRTSRGYDVAVEFSGPLNEEELFAVIEMCSCSYAGTSITVIPVKQDEFGSVEMYAQSVIERRREAEAERLRVSVRVHGGRLVAETVKDPHYPGIAISFQPSDDSARTDLALVEEADGLLYVRSYADMNREDPESFRCSYDPEMFAHMAYGLCGDDLEGVPFEDFRGRKLLDKDYMRKMLPERLYAEYSSMLERGLF